MSRPTVMIAAWERQALFALGVTVAVAGVARVWLFYSQGTMKEGLDLTTLTYFGVAGAFFLTRRIKSLGFGDYKLDLEAIESKAEEALEEAKTASSMARTMATPSESAAPRSVASADPWEVAPGGVEDDPWKGVFGGEPQRSHLRLHAEVAEITGEPDWFRIRLWIASTATTVHPLPDRSRVRFFIHDSFPQSRIDVLVVGGVAEIRLRAWGAFTVGALAAVDGAGPVRLELDLAEVDSFPARFRNR